MSDEFDEFDSDEFAVDDSFLKEVDSITAQARPSLAPQPPPPDNTNGSILPFKKANSATATGGDTVRSTPSGPSRLGFTPVNPPTPLGPPPSSDDYDDISFGAESLAQIDSLTTKPVPTRPSSGQLNTIPSSRLGMGRSTSTFAGFQTHLNFPRENQATKGKRWDRRAFAETGRRIGSEKVKGKSGYVARQWVKEDADESGDEKDEFEPLVPGPKSLVDTNKPYEPQRHLINPATIGTYIYPTNRPKRGYQYEIVRACFKDNCLVALPTGLGKTFVAGVVMLNFYRWFPTGKIVFLAPTKPLVNQQIEACQLTCGIPSLDAAVMTGSSVSAKDRAKLWDEKRVFYCTPQTLDNDLKSGAVDPKDIVLAVFDEAHKATGSYAYTTILAYITANHPYFRVLALTATPGADVPKVQHVVDALHISRIEIREAEAPEISKYMNEKHIEKHFVAMGEIIEGFRDRWAALMRPFIQKLVDAEVLAERDLDAKRLRPFRLTSRRMEIARDRTAGNRKWCLGPLQSLEKMARAMGHLLEFSIGMFHTILVEIAGNQTASGKKATTKGSSNSLRNNFEFQRLLKDVEAEINCIRNHQQGRTKADKHPKMHKTLELLLDHFQLADEDDKEHGVKNDTRAMVFCSFRECVMEVVDMLNEHPGLIRATKFVGQSQGKQEGDKGFNQKEQKKTIAEFKEGKFNVLVSTSIGEEGLDIGEVDFVVIYDMPKQSIKLLQRIGRTGRKRDGKVHVLMSEGREDANWDKAQETHREIQEEILHSRNLELFDDVEPLLPGSQLPLCIEQEMDVDPWDPGDDKGARKRLAGVDRELKKARGKGPAKEKRQRGHEIPEDGHVGFRSVAELLRENGKLKRDKRDARVLSESEGEEEEGLEDVFERIDTTTGGKLASHKTAVPLSTKRPTEEEEAEEIAAEQRKKRKASREEKERKAKAEREERDRMALDFFSSVGTAPRRRGLTPPVETPPTSPSAPGSPVKTLSISSDAGAMGKSKGDKFDTARTGETRTRLSPRTAAMAGFSQLDTTDFTWDPDLVSSPPPPPPALSTSTTPGVISKSTPSAGQKAKNGIRISSSSTPNSSVPPRPRIMGISRSRGTTSQTPLQGFRSRDAMPPPRLPGGVVVDPSSPFADPNPPGVSLDVSPPMSISKPDSGGPSPVMTTPGQATQFPVRRAGKRRAVVAPSSEEQQEQVVQRGGGQGRAALVDSSPVQPTRLRRRVDSSPVAERERRARAVKKQKRARRAEAFMDMDAEVSGSDHSSDEPDTDIETSSDRNFAGMEFAPTQAPRGYNQHAAYLAGLSTQLPSPHHRQPGVSEDKARDAPQFVKRGGGYDSWLAKARQPVLISDDETSEGGGGGGRPRGVDGSEDGYEMGSFVCDDEEVEFASQSDPLGSGF